MTSPKVRRLLERATELLTADERPPETMGALEAITEDLAMALGHTVARYGNHYELRSALGR